MQFVSQLQHWRDVAADKVALTFLSPGKRQFSYGQLWRLVEQLATQIQQETARGDVIYLACHRGVEQVIGLVACLVAGRAVVIVDLRQGLQRFATMLSASAGAAIYVDEAGHRLIEQLAVDASALPVHSVWRYSVTDQPLCQVNREVFSGGEYTVAPVEAPAYLTDTAVVLFTSGSTGQPKGVCIGSADLDNRLATEKQWFDLSESDAILGVLPLTFDVGLTQMLGTLYAGGNHVISAAWLPANILSAIEEAGIDGLALSPMVWVSLLGMKDSDRLWSILGRLRYITLSGGSLPLAQLRQVAENLAGPIFIKTYGQTEMFRIAALKYNGAESMLESVGRSYPGVELAVVDAEGRSCGINIVGEIVATGSGRMLGYLDGDHLTCVNEPIKTGDIGYLDEQGYLYIVARGNEMVKILDQRVFPEDVANSLRELLGVTNLWVVAVEHNGTRLVAALIQDEFGMSVAEIKKALRGQIASHMMPSEFLLLEHMPVTASGKIDKQSLKEMALSILDKAVKKL